jgi:hypothetical protein
MITLGIDQEGVDVYEGGGWLHAVYPPPILTPITLASRESAKAVPDSVTVINTPFLFREDSFDPTARIRRGRMYRRDNTQFQNRNVYAHPARQSEMRDKHRAATVLSKPLIIFHPHHLSAIVMRPLSDVRIILGTEQANSVWTIVDVERIHTNEELLTLRAIRSLGVLPNIKVDLLQQSDIGKIVQSLEILSFEIHKSAPESVIDRARDVISVAISSYLETKDLSVIGQDLGELIRGLNSLGVNDRRRIVSSAAEIVRLLHARSKPSEQEKRPTRRIMEQDAELAIACVGVTLCDFGWAVWD